jgi:hypothetical protein
VADVSVGDRVRVRCWTRPWKEHVRVVKEIDGLQVKLAVEMDGKETDRVEWEYLDDLKRVEEVR